MLSIMFSNKRKETFEDIVELNNEQQNQLDHMIDLIPR